MTQLKLFSEAPRKTPTSNVISGVIYRPEGEAAEYATLATNPYTGCGMQCGYCYVVHLPGQPDRKLFNAGAVPREDYLVRLRRDARRLQERGITGQVMISFTSDAYNPVNTSLTRPTLETLIDNGFGFCVLTKGGTRALRDMGLYRPERDAFAATLTTLDDRASLKWEPKAPLPGDRIAALKVFHQRGIFTWVSLEPVIDVAAAIAIVEATHGFVDLFKIGRLNYLPATETTDWRAFTLRMLDVLNRLGVSHYFKRTLQPYLPPGYPNPLRVAQCHPPAADNVS
jgi:hypothetical protein